MHWLIGCLSKSFSRPQHLFRWQFLQFLLLAASERQPWLEKTLLWDARRLADLDFEVVPNCAHVVAFFGSVAFICLWLNRGSSGGMHVQPLYSILAYAAPRNLVLRHENRDHPKRPPMATSIKTCVFYDFHVCPPKSQCY